MIAVRYGLGDKMKGAPGGKQETVLKMMYAGQLLYLVALAISKAAVAALLHRLAGTRKQKRAALALMCAIAAWGVAGIFALGLRQDLAQPWSAESLFAESTHVRWVVVETSGLVFEALIFASVLSLVWNLHANQSTKSTVVGGFLFRLGLFAIVPVRLYYASRAYHSNVSVSPTFAATLPEILSQLEMHYSAIGATVPCLRIFLRSFHSGYLGGLGLDAPDDYYSRSGTNMATKGSRGGGGKDTLNSIRVNVTRSIELTTLDRREVSPSTDKRNSQAELIDNDAASDGSANPLYHSTARAGAYFHR
ncbi:hypothetical protein LTR85_009093 [Meristemomyces frigidus]|nr:hypothetical protein LTR85_009093 [Meristemomyces frigidus]